MSKLTSNKNILNKVIALGYNQFFAKLCPNLNYVMYNLVKKKIFYLKKKSKLFRNVKSIQIYYHKEEDLFQVGFNSNPNQAIFNPDLVRVGSGLVHNIEIFCSFTCLCGWYSLFPIKYRSTDKHLDENHHRMCCKIDIRRSWSLQVKGKSPIMI